MVQVLPNKVKKLWETWDLRVFIIISLALQVCLLLFASSRKKTGNILLIMLIWSTYLLADWIAAIAIGFISNSQGDSSGPAENNHLLALWAPFLLLHLGGPDTITSFSLEDNELWIRHLLGLILQVLASVYVFLQSLPKNKLWAPTILVLVAGTIKYAERTCALYLASMQRFGNSMVRKLEPGSGFERVQAIYNSMKKAHIPLMLININAPDKALNRPAYALNKKLDEEITLLLAGYGFYERFKRIIVGFLFSPKERRESRHYFLRIEARHAFKLVEMELSLLYEVLHTKANVVRCRTGCIFRLICFFSLLVAFLSFHMVEKHAFQKFDARLTYALFIGAIVMETISVLMLIYSDWTIICFKNWWVDYQSKKEKNRRVDDQSKKEKNRWVDYITSHIVNRRRWSESVSQYNLITHCRRDSIKWVKKLADLLCINDFLQKMEIMLSLTTSDPITEQLKKFIYDELKKKSKTAKDVKTAEELCTQRGAWVLRRESRYILLPWCRDIGYVESVLQWHIATEICYNIDESNVDSADHKEFSKVLSDYMLYLLIMQPTMMAPVSGNWQYVFQDTCAEAKRLFRNKSSENQSDRLSFYQLAKRLFCRSTLLGQRDACKSIDNVKPIVKAGAMRGYANTSVLFDAYFLAKELSKIRQKKWTLMSQVWVELLTYAAIHCKAEIHAQQPSRGGELLTVIWLLMNHLGLGKQFYEESKDRVKIIVRK